MEGTEWRKSSARKKLFKWIETKLGSSSTSKPASRRKSKMAPRSSAQQITPEEMIWDVSKGAADVDSQKFKESKKPAEEVVVQNLPKLPEELVEQIMARVPFPYVFKARVLSKSWLARLSSISSQEDEEKRSLAISFQTRMLRCSLFWKTFCSETTRAVTSPDDDCTSDARERLPSLSLLPDILSNRLLRRLEDTPQTEGAILLIRAPRRLISNKSFPPAVLVL
jgi:hypothetical protein